MPTDSKVLVPYNVLNTSSPLVHAGHGLTSIETNRASAQCIDERQSPAIQVKDKQAVPASKERLTTTLKTSDDPLELVWQAWQDKYEQAKTFIEQGYNEQEIDIQRDLITELKQAEEDITNIPAELSSPVDAMISDANSKSKGWIDELAKSDRANAYQLARHIDGSLKVVTEALKAFKHDQDLELETWKEKASTAYKQKHGLTQDTDNLHHHMTLRRHAVRNRLQEVRYELESSKNKIQRKGWRNTFKREAEVKDYFSHVMNALEGVINDLKNKQKQFDPSFKDSAASILVSKAGQSKEEKLQRGEHEQDKESKNINLAELEVAMGEQILKFEDAAVKATKSTVAKMGEGAKNKMAKVAMQVARTPTYVAPTAMHLLHKARSPMAKGVNKALNHSLSDEDQIIRSIVRSLCWTLIQPAFRMQYDYAPLLGAAQSLAKSKDGVTDSVDVLETVTEGSAATSGIKAKATTLQSEQGSGEAEKSRQEVLEPSLKKAQQTSESLLAQVSLGGNGALREVLNHYQPADLTKLSEQLQGLSLSEETPDTKIRPSLGKDVQTLKNLLAQEPSNRDAQLNQVSASERERLVNILATIKDMGLSEQRFNKTVDYFLGVGQDVLSEEGQKSLGKAVVEIEDALRKGEAYKKVRAMALKLRARATKESEYKDSSLDSIIHKARFAGLAARDAYDELDSLALKHTGQPLGPFSRRSRVAKDWGMCANEVLREAGHTDAALIPDTEVIRHALTERNMLTGLVSEKDPLGIFFSTRIAGEWRYAYRDETIKPMSPAEYAAQEKTLAEFIVSWSQKRLARGVVVSFIEGGVDMVGGLTVTPIKIGVRAGIKVPISLIRIGYDVHKIKQGVMPGEDKPYKVIKARITHRLEQLGFKMVMIPVGNTVKTVFAAGVSAAAHAHNAMVEKEEDKVKISSWAKVLGTEALLTGGSVPITLGAKTAADLVMNPSPTLTTDEQQVIEQIKQALVDESPSEELEALDEPSTISKAYSDIDRGEGEYKEAVDASLAKIASTPFGRDLIESMNEQGIEITHPNEEERLRQEDGQTYYATYANPEQNTIFFDPWNTLAAESDEQANDKPWLRRDPSIALFHEMLHLYYHSHPVKVNYQDAWLTIDELGTKLAPEGSSEEETELLSHGIFEHFVAGADYDANGVHLPFSDLSFIEQSVQVENGRYISENDYREAFYRARGQAVIRRLDYGDSSFTGHDGDRYAPSQQGGDTQRLPALGDIAPEDAQSYQDYLGLGLIRDELKGLKQLLNSREKQPEEDIAQLGSRLFVLHEKLIGIERLLEKKLGNSGVITAQMPSWEIDSLNKVSSIAGSLEEYASKLSHFVDGKQVKAVRSVHVKQSQILDRLGLSIFEGSADQLQLRMLEDLGSDFDRKRDVLERGYIGVELPLRSLEQGWGIETSVDTMLIDDLIKVGFPDTDNDTNTSTPVLVISSNGRNRKALSILNVGQFLSTDRSSRLDTPWGRVPFQAFRVPPSIEPIQTVLKSVHDKISSEPRDRMSRMVSARDRYEALRQELRPHYALGPQQFDRDPDSSDILLAMNHLKGAIAYLAYDYTLLIGRPPSLEAQGEGYSGYMKMRGTVNSLIGDIESHILAEEITNDISESPVFEGYRWPLLPSEMMYLDKFGLNSKETLLNKILQYRQGRGELHENVQQVEAEFYASMKDIVQDNEAYTVAQQREEIRAHGGLIAYEREIMNKTYMAYFFDRVSPDSAAYRYWKENGIDQPGKVKFAIEHIDRTPRQVDDYIKENKGTGYRGLERLIGKQITYSSGLSQERYTIGYKNIESALGKEYLYSVNQEELDNVNWSTERYTKLLRERATEKIESIAGDNEKAVALNLLDRALNPVQYREDPRDIPHIIKPFVGYPRESIGEIIKGDSYPLENMIVIIDGDNYTMISLMPDGRVHNFSSRQDLNRFFRNPSNHEYLLSHASLYNQMDGRSKKGMATILEELSASKDHRNDNRYILTDELKHRMDAKSVFSSLAAGSKGYYQSKLYSEIDLVTGLKKNYSKGLSDTVTVITEPSYGLPEAYQKNSFKELYNTLNAADLQPMITDQIDDFKSNRLDVFKGYLKAEYKNIVNKAQLKGILSSQEATDIINHPERMFIPSLRNQVKHYPLEGMMMTKRGNAVILISLQSNGGVHKFDSERDFNLFFANPANKDYILSHMSERNKQPRGIKGKGPSDFLDTLASWSNKYYRTNFVAEELPVAHPADKFPMIGPQSPDKIINVKPVRFNANDDAFEIMATRMLDRLRSDADTLITSDSEWATDKFFEISGYVLAAASIVLTAGAAAGVGGVYVAGTAFVVDVISAAHGITEGLYVVIKGDTPEQRRLGLLPLVLAPLDMFGAVGGAAELRRLGKAGGTVTDSLATGGRRLPPVEESNEFDGIRTPKNRRRSIRAVLDNFGLTRRGNSQTSVFDALPKMEQSPSWYTADNLYTPKTSAHGVIFKDPDNPDRLIKFYKRPSDRGIAENNRDVLNKLYDQDAELNTLRGIDGETYYAVNMPKMKGISIENIEEPDVMLGLLRRIEESDFIAHWVGKLQDNGIRVEDLNLGSVLYDPTTRDFSLVDFDSSTISDSVSNSHYKQMYRSLHTPIRDQLIKKAKTLFEGQEEMLDTVKRVEEKLNLRFRELMSHNEYGQESFSILMKGQNGAGDREGWGSARLPMGGDAAGSQSVPSTNGRNIYGHDNPMSKPRQDVNSDGTWAGEQGTFYDDVDLTDILPDDKPWTNLGTSSRPRSVDYEGNSYRIKYTDERSAEAGRTTQYRASLISDSGEEIPVRIKVATNCSEAYAYVGKSGSPMNSYMPELVGVTDSQGLPISDIGRGQIREEPIFLILRDEVKALEETGSSVRKVLDVKFSDVRLRSTPAERAVNGYPEKSSLYYAAKNKAMDSSGIPFINHNGGNELNKFLAIRNTKKKLLSVLNTADNLEELKAQLESFRQAVMASDWVSYDSSLLLIAHAKNGQTKIDFKFIDPAHPVTRQAGTNSQALNSGKSAMQDSINWMSEEIDLILYRRSAAREGLMSYESPTSSRILSSSSAEDLTVLDDIVFEEGFKPYIKPNGRDYIYFPFMNDERVTERLVPLLRDRISNGKPPIEVVFKNREQIDTFREILNRVFPANSRLEADLEYLYTSANKMDLTDLRDSDTLYVSGHGQPGQGYVYSAASPNADKVSAKEVAKDIDGMLLPDDVTVKVAACNSASGRTIIAPSSKVDGDLYAHITDPANMGDFDVSLAGKLEIVLKTLQEGRELGKVYGYLGYITNRRIQTGMGKIQGGQLTFGTSTHAVAGFDVLGDSKGRLVDFRRSDMMRGRFYDPNPMLGKHGLQELSSDIPPLNPALRQEALKPKLLKRRGLALVQAQGSEPNKQVYFAEAGELSARREAWYTVWENTARASDTPNTDVFVAYNGKQLNIEDIVKHMDSGGLQQYKEASGYIGTNPVSFVRIVRVSEDGAQEENQYEITVETLETQLLE